MVHLMHPLKNTAPRRKRDTLLKALPGDLCLHVVACMRTRTMGRPSTESSEERGFRTPGSGDLLTQLVQMEMVIRSSGDTFRDGHPPFYEAALSIGYGFH